MCAWLEYSGLDTSNPLDVTAGAVGTGGSPNSGAATTNSAKELIFGAGMTGGHFVRAGTGFTSRVITSPDGDIAEDQIVSATGSYSAVAPLSYSSAWIMQMATFRASGQGTSNPAPIVSLDRADQRHCERRYSRYHHRHRIPVRRHGELRRYGRDGRDGG